MESKVQPATLEITKDRSLLYTYPEENGTFATTDKAEDVPEKVRGMVRVVDPAQALGTDPSSVLVLDLNELLSAGKTAGRYLSREAFETSAMAQLPPGESSLVAGQHGPPLPMDNDFGDAGVGGIPVVILYGTPWCGACKTAKQYLSSRRIPYAYKDIENDPQAARELAEKAAKLGVPADRVPILDVRGRLLIGFDKDRLEAILGTPT
jgi:glutaredoxin